MPDRTNVGGTVTAADSDASPALAVILATPSVTPVTRPVPSTVATAGSLDSHENSACDISSHKGNQKGLTGHKNTTRSQSIQGWE